MIVAKQAHINPVPSFSGNALEGQTTKTYRLSFKIWR